MVETKKFSLVKPTLDTPFHIDFAWWTQYDNNWRVFLHDYLCPEHQEKFANLDENYTIDWVDPETAEISALDGLQHTLMSHCALQPGFVDNHTTLVDAVFRVMLSNGNKAMSPKELASKIDRPAETILRTLTGPQIFKGLRPCNC
jgi:hypothetical protein